MAVCIERISVMSSATSPGAAGSRQLHSAIAAAVETYSANSWVALGLDETSSGRPHDVRRDRLAFELYEGRFGLEEVNCDGARPEQVDDALGLGGKWGAGRERVRCAGGDARRRRSEHASRPPARSDASAILPTPTPHSAKKCRRVISRSSAALRAGCWLQGMAVLSYPLARYSGRGLG